MKAKEINFLFVYGKLREYYTYEETYDVASLVTFPVRTTGMIYEYDGDIVLIEDKNSIVYGNLLISTDINTLLRHTDRIMEFNEDNYEGSKYIRGIKEVEITMDNIYDKVKAWVYVYPTSRKRELDKNGTFIESGDWVEYKNALIEKKGKKDV